METNANIDKLKNLVSRDIYHQLLEAKINSLFYVLSVNKAKFNECTKLTDEQINDVRKAASDIILGVSFRTADQIKPWRRLSTGCDSIDYVLNGGIPLNGITEIYGSSGVGKTQFGLQLALKVQQPIGEGGLQRGALYICTEDVFPARRLHELANICKEICDINYENNIFIEHIATYDQLKQLFLIKLRRLLPRELIGLLIIDSIAGLFRSENFFGDYRTRSRQITECASLMVHLSQKHQTAIVCLNQVSHSILENHVIPCLGLAWSNNVTYRCCITRSSHGPNRKFEVIFAPDLPNVFTSFMITSEGIRNNIS